MNNTGSNESVIHTTQRLIISGTSYEVTLTPDRLVLTNTDSERPAINIPYSAIELASAETNKLREPVIRITYTVPDGGSRGIELIFIFLAAGRNFQNRDKCLTVLETMGVPVRPDPTPPDYISRTKRERMDAGTLDVEKPPGRPAVPEWTVYGPQGGRSSLPEEPAPTSPVFTVIAMILIAALVIGAMVAPIPAPGENQTVTVKALSVRPGTTPQATPSPEVTPVPAAVSQQEQTLSPGGVPLNGIWVRVSSPGGYTGSLKAGGLVQDVAGSGTLLYQLPVSNTVIDGEITKLDGSGEALVVEVFNGGSSISSATTEKPFGTIELHVPVGPSLAAPTVSTPVPTLTATPATVTTADTSVVPANGVFVRIVYPGQYTGSISANGFERVVNTSGDQVYQLSLANGNIDAFLEKGDGSVRNMLVQVFKNGVLVTSADTSVPLGVVEIHTTV
jgi:hypothetical protein